MRPTKTQISLRIRPVWSESSPCVQWVAKDRFFLHADSDDWSDWADAQADLSLHWAHMPFGSFCHEAAQLVKTNAKRVIMTNWAKQSHTSYCVCTFRQKWMDGIVRVLRPFNSISVTSRRWKDEHERLCAMKRRLGSGRISPPAGFEPATPWTEVGNANRSATRTLLDRNVQHWPFTFKKKIALQALHDTPPLCLFLLLSMFWHETNINVNTRFDQIHQLFHKILSINIIKKSIKGHNSVEKFGERMCISHSMDNIYINA